MGIKKMLGIRPPKEMTDEENREYLMDAGVAVKNPKKKKREKFSAYGIMGGDRRFEKAYAPSGYEQHARPNEAQEDDGDDLNKSVVDYRMDDGRSNPYGNTPSNSDSYNNSGNPYERYSNAGSANPYERTATSANAFSPPIEKSSGNNDPYSGNTNGEGNPYSNSGPSGAYGGSAPNQNGSSQGMPRPQRGDIAGGRTANGGNPFGRRNTRNNGFSDGNVAPSSDRISGSSPRIPASAKSPSLNPYSNMSNNVFDTSTSTSSSTVASPGDAYQNSKMTPSDTFDFENGPGAYRQGQNDDDLNAAPRQSMYGGGNYNDDDLNASIYENGNDEYTDEPYDDSKGYKTFEELQHEEQAKQQVLEDEEVDEIKQKIRFTKQSSVASTRNTLKMAQDAEIAGMNTLGMLGNQSEKMNNIEGNLTLMKVQNRTADDKVKELKKLNRSVFAIHASNPFTSKRRLREQEEKIKTQRMQDKIMQQDVDHELYSSTRRIGDALDDASRGDEIKERYQRREALERSKRYQFENNEEDDDMELEMDKNLDKIAAISSRLKKLAIATGEEVDKQQVRVRNIEEDTDDLDIKIHLNTHRLRDIK